MSDKINMVQAINWALDDAMAADKKVLVLGEDVADHTGGGVVGVTRGLSEKYGRERVVATPISETAFTGAAIGAAMMGFKPVVEIMLMNFMTVCSDMIVNHAAKLRFMSGGQTSVPMVIRTMTGPGFGSGGQHSDFLEGWFAHTAGLKVVIPSTPADAYGLMRSAIDDPDPVIFVENGPMLWTPGDAPERGSKVEIGKARTIREGKDVTVIGYGRIIQTFAAHAAKLDDLSVEIIDLRSVQPWDKAAVLASVKKTGAAVVVHEACKEFGPGGEIASTIHENLHGVLRGPVARLGAKFSAVPFSNPLETAYVPSAQEIEAACRNLVGVPA
jgi:pyruvate dehydrogenase E1 component beta subunit